MKKILLVALLLSGCASNPYKWPEDYGITCAQTEEQKLDGTKTCLRTISHPDTYKWHRVREWQELPEIPDTP